MPKALPRRAGSSHVQLSGADSLRLRLNFLFAPLNESQVPTAYLEEYALRLRVGKLPAGFYVLHVVAAPCPGSCQSPLAHSGQRALGERYLRSATAPEYTSMKTIFYLHTKQASRAH